MKETKLNVKQRVRVYWNFHKKCFSVQQQVGKRWKVVEHTDKLTLKDVEFKVSEAGRQRVLREKRKNVHAYIFGSVLTKPLNVGIVLEDEITYDPYKHQTFVCGDEPMKSADYVKVEAINGHGKISW